MKLTIKKEPLEKILIANWTSILNVRELLTFVSNITSENSKSQSKIDKITISRFELINDYFLIWIEYSNGNKNGTIECHLHLNGELVPKLII